MSLSSSCLEAHKRVPRQGVEKHQGDSACPIRAAWEQPSREAGGRMGWPVSCGCELTMGSQGSV